MDHDLHWHVNVSDVSGRAKCDVADVSAYACFNVSECERICLCGVNVSVPQIDKRHDNAFARNIFG